MKLKKINEISSSFFDKRGIGFHWKKIVGDFLSKHSSPIGFEKGTLKVASLSPSFTQHMSYLRNDIIKKIYEETGIKVEKIRILSSSKGNSFKKIDFYNESLEESIKPEQIEEKRKTISIFNFIDDESLKNKLERVASVSIIRNEIYKKD